MAVDNRDYFDSIAHASRDFETWQNSGAPTLSSSAFVNHQYPLTGIPQNLTIYRFSDNTYGYEIGLFGKTHGIFRLPEEIVEVTSISKVVEQLLMSSEVQQRIAHIQRQYSNVLKGITIH